MERPRSDGPMVTGFAGDGYRIDGAVFPAALLTPERVVAWSPPPLDELDLAALTPLFDGGAAFEFVLLGTGATLRQPPRSLVRAVEARGSGIEAMDSRAAARAWGLLRAEGRRIGAALYPLE